MCTQDTTSDLLYVLQMSKPQPFQEMAKEGWIILDLDEVVKTNHISSQTKELSAIQFGS